ncbi:MAG TPA: hypothetical protein VKB79_06355 [Bryobacteraceae bacterium]|nr:hypothetical protein [Bryobacteraceae bacterium]
MTFEEKAEFLMQSIASRDRQLGELTDSVRAHDQQIVALGEKIDAMGSHLSSRVERLAEVTQLSFERLTKAMTFLTDIVADHERRIGKIDNGAG